MALSLRVPLGNQPTIIIKKAPTSESSERDKENVSISNVQSTTSTRNANKAGAAPTLSLSSAAALVVSSTKSDHSSTKCSNKKCASLRVRLTATENTLMEMIRRTEHLEAKYRICWKAAHDCKGHVSAAEHEKVLRENELLRNAHIGKTVLSAPPAWQRANACTTCRNTFTLTRRRHHCRSCGHSLCSSCIGSDEFPLPHLGFFKPVRVCTSCTKAIALAHTAAAAATAAHKNTNMKDGLSGIAVLPPAIAASTTMPANSAPIASIGNDDIRSPTRTIMPTPLATPATIAVPIGVGIDGCVVEAPSVPSSPAPPMPSSALPLPNIPADDIITPAVVATAVTSTPQMAPPPTPPPFDMWPSTSTSLPVVSSIDSVSESEGKESLGNITNTNDSNTSTVLLTSSSIQQARLSLRRASTTDVINTRESKEADATRVRDQMLAAIRARAASAASSSASSSSTSSTTSSLSCTMTPRRAPKTRSASFSGQSPKDMLTILQQQVRARRVGITRGSDDASSSSTIVGCNTPVVKRCPPTPTSHQLLLRTPIPSISSTHVLDESPAVPLKPSIDEWTD